ncbi:DUF305 domain-containing protein [Aphanothece sacrum]|uniref:DUF305 domain-containing protein n=1 Tax=Aphanothece sacrum FPU1 TaxID=1920663 RepID=A0A401IF73_APHSA|nr:DUF305 domain-containing protein [Aphanothece sacrum]GBF79947.1 hypothetical protein AsFPU1_1347 [Aphanothece sacrum FPU1]GBF83833.1 hypothetical protein AsFPU3_0877 [Aphanothece sacrum FPU3]
MKPVSDKTKFLALTLIALVSLTSVGLTSCATSSQKDIQTSKTTTNGSNNQQMNHESMNHGSNMSLGPNDEYYDLRFIDAMRLHHAGAIAMAKEASEKSQRPEIKSLARNIIVAQQREEKDLLQKWRQVWYPKASKEPVVYGSEIQPIIAMTKEQEKSMAMVESLGADDDKFDLRFMDGMIIHHEGAVAMAKDALNKSKRTEIKQLANEIISSQQKEIEQMKQWLKTWYKQ